MDYGIQKKVAFLMRLVVCLVLFGMTGCTASNAVVTPPSFIDPYVGFPNQRYLDALWITQFHDTYILTALYKGSSSIGGEIPNYGWCVRTRLKDGGTISSSHWPGNNSTALAGESEALFYYRATQFTSENLIATNGPFGITGSQSNGYTVVKTDGAAVRQITSFPPRSLLLNYFDGKQLIGLDFSTWGAETIGHVVVTEAGGSSQKWVPPAGTKEILTNGSEVITSSDSGAIAFKVTGEEQWHDQMLKAPNGKIMNSPGFVGQTAILAQYFVYGNAEGFSLRRFSDNTLIASVPLGHVETVYSARNVTVVECSERPTQDAAAGRDDSPHTLYAFVDGKLVYTQPIPQASQPVVVRDGLNPLIGWQNHVYDVVNKCQYIVSGNPVCCVDSCVISEEDNKRLYTTRVADK